MARASDLLHGLVISTACQALPVRKPYPSSGDLLDNEWPIEWSMSEVEGNSHFTLDGVVYRKVSDVSIDAEWENVTGELTAKAGTDKATVQLLRTSFSADEMRITYVAISGDIGFGVEIIYCVAGEYDGITIPETGLYCNIRDMDTGAEADAAYDIRLALTKTPTAYSYNGVILPALPQYDKAKYHAYIHRLSSINGGNHEYYLSLQEDKISVMLGGTTYVKPSHRAKDGVWDEYTPTSATTVIVWSDVDVYYADSVVDLGGTLYLAASEPVPVYE